MVFLEIGAAVSSAKNLFIYNRENFMFDKELSQEALYHLQKMRVEQVDLYREDIRDLFDLTIKKMDNYLIINTLILAFAMGFYYEGQLPPTTSSWLFTLWAMSLSCTMLFMLISIWFSIHASLTAQTFAVKLLTQWLRLPVPGISRINEGVATAEDFERSNVVDSSLRIPFLFKKNRHDDVTITEDQRHSDDLIFNYDSFVSHFVLFRQLQSHWLSYDAYARVSMVIGTNQLLFGIGYMALAYFFIDSENVHFWGTFGILSILCAFMIIHLILNLSGLSKFEWIILISSIFCSFSLVFANSIIEIIHDHSDDTSNIIFPIIVLFNIIFNFSLFYHSVIDRTLPIRFATVSNIDVLGVSDNNINNSSKSTSRFEFLRINHILPKSITGGRLPFHQRLRTKAYENRQSSSISIIEMLEKDINYITKDLFRQEEFTYPSRKILPKYQNTFDAMEAEINRARQTIAHIGQEVKINTNNSVNIYGLVDYIVYRLNSDKFIYFNMEDETTYHDIPFDIEPLKVPADGRIQSIRIAVKNLILKITRIKDIYSKGGDMNTGQFVNNLEAVEKPTLLYKIILISVLICWIIILLYSLVLAIFEINSLSNDNAQEQPETRMLKQGFPCRYFYDVSGKRLIDLLTRTEIFGIQSYSNRLCQFTFANGTNLL